MLPRGRLGNNLFRHLKVRRAFCLTVRSCTWQGGQHRLVLPMSLLWGSLRVRGAQFYISKCLLCFSCATRSHHAVCCTAGV